MKTKLIFAILSLTLSLTGRAQDIEKYSTITIGEFTVGGSYTDEQILAVTGNKPEFLQVSSDDRMLHFKYNGNSLYTMNDCLHCFDLSNENLKLCGRVGVGNDIDAIDDLNLIRGRYEEGSAGITYHYAYAANDSRELSPYIFYLKNNRIVRVTYLKHDDVR